MMIQSARLKKAIRTINEPCPKCGHSPMERRTACCGDRRRGVKYVKKCPKCRYRERVK